MKQCSGFPAGKIQTIPKKHSINNYFFFILWSLIPAWAACIGLGHSELHHAGFELSLKFTESWMKSLSPPCFSVTSSALLQLCYHFIF